MSKKQSTLRVLTHFELDMARYEIGLLEYTLETKFKPGHTNRTIELYKEKIQSNLKFIESNR